MLVLSGSVDGREHDSPGFDGSIAEVPTCAQSSEVGALPFVGMHHVLPSDEHHSGSALETFAKDDHMQPIEQPGTTCNGFGQHLHVDIQHTAPKASTGNGIHAQRIYFRDFMGAAANKNAIWQGKSLLPDRLKGPAEELIADIPLNAASNPLDSRRTTKSKPANSPKNKAKKAVVWPMFCSLSRLCLLHF